MCGRIHPPAETEQLIDQRLFVSGIRAASDLVLCEILS